MDKKLTQDCLDSYVWDAFTELRPHVELHHKESIEEMEQARNQIVEIIELWYRYNLWDLKIGAVVDE